MKAPQSKATRQLLKDPKSADSYFRAKRKAIRSGTSVKIGGSGYSIEVLYGVDVSNRTKKDQVKLDK